MSYSFYESTVPSLKACLESLRAILKEGEKHAASKSIPVDDIVAWRLVDDMLPLSFQVQMVTDIAMKFVARVNEEPMEQWSTEFKTVADLYARIDAAEAWLGKAKEETLAKRANETVELQMGPKIKKELPAKGWWAAYGEPNLYFHLTTAYTILRSKGVPLGKMNYIAPFTTGWFTVP